MSTTMKEILEQTRQLVAVKQAEFKSNLAGGTKSAKGLDTAGAGDDMATQHKDTSTCDQPALEPVKKPAITSDAKANPPSDESGTGKNKAEGKDEGNQTDRTDALEADEAALEPGKKPLITADANAKKADMTAKLANDILASIREVKSAAPKAPVKAAAAPAPKAQVTEKKDEKVAAGPQLELTSDVLSKIAAIVLSTEEGAEFVEGQLAKAAGAEAAEEMLHYLAEQSELCEKQAAYQQGQADAQALIDQQIYEAGIQAAGGTKQANDYFAKLGQAVADASIEDLMNQGGAGAEGAAPAGMPPAAGGEGGGEGAVSPEELAQVIQALIADGTISEDEAGQIIEYLSSGGEQVPEEAAAAGIEPKGAGPAPAQAPAVDESEPVNEAKDEKSEAEKDEAPKEASVKVSSLLEQIRRLKVR